MGLEIIGKTKDLRTSTIVVYSQISINGYLHLIGDDFEKFTIQRRREKHKAYERMKKDLTEGALLPSITLAVKSEYIDSLIPLIEEDRFDELSEQLSQPGRVNILDGLQRTYILKDLQQENVKFEEEQTIHLEFWLEKNIKHLIYRIIVLNAGQKPMSMRHQIELLFMTLRYRLEEQIDNLEIYTERDETRRRRSRKYALDRIATAYQCFITRSPEVDRENIVAQKLIEADVLDSSEAELTSQFDLFVNYLGKYAEIDDEICRIYPGGLGRSLPTGANWLGSLNVMNSFFAAISQFGINENRLSRINNALENLYTLLKRATEGDDPLNLEIHQSILTGINSRKVNVGFATRKFLTNGFKEFFREAGEITFADCWKIATE